MAKICDWFRDDDCDLPCDGLDPSCSMYSGDLIDENKDANPMSKKGNMAYWDAIDELTEGYVRQLVACSINPVRFGDEEDADEEDDHADAVMDIGKQITEFATKLLESQYGALFPYVDENY